MKIILNEYKKFFSEIRHCDHNKDSFPLESYRTVARLAEIGS